MIVDAAPVGEVRGPGEGPAPVDILVPLSAVFPADGCSSRLVRQVVVRRALARRTPDRTAQDIGVLPKGPPRPLWELGVTVDHWDVIVVGAGSAGAPLAARLAASQRRVLLLEAGPDYRSAALPEVWRSPNPIRALLDPDASRHLVWPELLATRTDSQAPAPYWRGRGTGGSSAVNGQIAIRPPLEDFDDWAAAACTGWSANDVLPFFNRLEDDEQFGDEPYHGDGGPIPVHRAPRQAWGAVDTALHAAGHPWAEDVNAPGAAGVSPYPINSRVGRRVSVNDAYLEPARGDGDLTIRGDALVERVLVERGRAVGVRYLSSGLRPVEVRAELVVLSAGAVHSPAILMRSGIGPAAVLHELGIGVVMDLPVGRGLQDHPLAGIPVPLREEATIRTPDDRHTNVCVRYSSAHADGGPLDMMLVSFNQNILPMEKEARFGAGGFGVWVNQPWSRGSVELVSADPTVQPRVRESMLSDRRDRERLREGVRMLAELCRDPAVVAITAETAERANPGLFSVLDDDIRLDARLLDTVADAQHATSTCRMGAADDPSSVVTPDCRVLGVDGLRVVDASVFPTVPRANTHLVTVMAGELMADRIGG